jgi:dTDP-4-amino-4,6-dideoxygalactose transaminase
MNYPIYQLLLISGCQGFILLKKVNRNKKLNEKYLSHFGDISCFSTHDRKILPTGEGGFCLTSSQSYYKKMQSYIKFGNMNGVDFGLNFKLGSMQAGLGINRIDQISTQIEKRTKNAKYILDKIDNKKINEFKIIKKGSPNYYALLLEVNNDNCDKFIDYLEKNGIPSDIKRYNDCYTTPERLILLTNQ